jgi:glutathione S-transferase
MGCGGSNDGEQEQVNSAPAGAPTGAPAAPGESKNVGKMVYFGGARSRGEPTQIIAAYEGLTMEAELIDFEEWGKRKSDKIPYMPYIEQPDGSIMLDTEVILKHLAVTGGKFVVDDKTADLAHRGNSAPLFLTDPYVNAPAGQEAAFGAPDPKETWLEQVKPEWKKLAEELGDGPFFAGEKPGYGEAFIWHNIDQGMILDKAAMTEACGEEGMKKLEAWHAKFAALDGVKDYLAKRPKKFGFPDSFASKLE